MIHSSVLINIDKESGEKVVADAAPTAAGGEEEGRIRGSEEWAWEQERKDKRAGWFVGSSNC